MRSTNFLLALIIVSSHAFADVRLPRLFSDQMVLQQQTDNPIWGTAEPGETIAIEASWGAKASAIADEDGSWMTRLNTPAHGTGYQVVIRGANTISLRDVAIGEVWLCAGQSNMGWALANTFAAESESTAEAPNFRIFKSSREHWHEPLTQPRDRLAKWSKCDPESAAMTSAVSYHFGKTLHDALDIPVGIIVQAYAGTPIEGWMPKNIQADDPRLEESTAQMQRISRRFDREEALQNYQRELGEYEAKIDAGQTMKNQWRPLAPPIITKPAILGHQYPSHIFNAMIHPIRPYGIRGAIWYQGERNSKNVPQAAHYRGQLAKLIQYYRKSWHELSGGNVANDFPFFVTQLPSWNPPQTKPVEGLEAPWAVNREMMRLVAQDVPNTGMVVSIDTGDAIALHPKNKRPLGIRHALLALKATYGKDIVDSGPRFKSQMIDGNHIVLSFDSIGSGLTTARPGKIDSFAIAGADAKWRWADAKIVNDTIVVSSSQVDDPVAVRYAWAMNPSQRNLIYNAEGLPASPFRTDTWPLFETGDPIVEVIKPVKPDGYEPTDWDRPVMTSLANMASEESNGLAPEVADLNADDVSFALEKNIPDLQEPYLSCSPDDRKDGISVGVLGIDGGERDSILAFAREIAEGKHGDLDSLLLAQDGKLLFESYYRRGRINYPHYQMSITKSYTALAIGRAIQLGFLKMSDLNRPVLSFLKKINTSQLASGAETITLAQVLNMKSGIRIPTDKINALRQEREVLKGQRQIQAYMQHSAAITPDSQTFKYQGSDPSIAMQVLESVVPGSARHFIETELLKKLGITNFAWQDDVSGLPKSAAGSSMRSRDMLKWALLVANDGVWNGEPLIPPAFITKATSRLHTNSQQTSYGYFWWRHDMQVGDQKYDCISGRGAGGQFILWLPQLDLIAVVTAHNRGMGKMLATVPKRILPAFIPQK